MAKKSSWKAQAKRKEASVGIGAAIDLDLFPNLGDILNGYMEDGKAIGGGSVLMFVGNDGKLTAIVSPKGVPNQFWCNIAEMERVFECIERCLQDGKGTWRGKKDPKK